MIEDSSGFTFQLRNVQVWISLIANAYLLGQLTFLTKEWQITAVFSGTFLVLRVLITQYEGKNYLGLVLLQLVVPLLITIAVSSMIQHRVETKQPFPSNTKSFFGS